MLPSKNCKTKMMLMTMTTIFSETVAAKRTAGTAPIIGPKYGITFVTPMINPNKSG